MSKKIPIVASMLLLFILGCSNNSNPSDSKNSPQIVSIVPVSAKIGDVLTLSGKNFGESPGSSFVSFSSLSAITYTGWTNTEINVKVPSGATSGKVSVTINGTKSNEVNFVISASTPADTIIIGTQTWQTKNLVVDRYRNGDLIPEVKDSTVWATLKTGAWCYFKNDSALGAIYGKLYNWYAVIDSRGLAPAGWHVANDSEWTTLIVYLGGGSFAGGKLKETGTTHWNSPNTSASNESGFFALPGGNRANKGSFIGSGTDGIFWSTTESVSTSSMARYLKNTNAIVQWHADYKEYGFSVRCLRN